MSIQKHFEKKESAVSPVVGVMLMLVVTIVIAAVVAMSAMGTFSDAQPASTVVLKLDDCKMKIAAYSPDYTGPVAKYAAVTVDGDTFVTSVSYSEDYTTNYAPYEMKFRNMGGDTLSVADLTLNVTYNATTYNTPFNIVTKATTWSPSEVIVLNAREADPCPTDAGVKNAVWVLGLSQQNMGAYWDTYVSPIKYTEAAKDYFDWSILDRSGNAIAKGTYYFPKVTKGIAPPSGDAS